MSGELKACAHCGRNAALGINERLHHTVGCSWCDACVGASTGYRTTDAAIAAWNRRAPAWEGIESAPRDGTWILVWLGGLANVADTVQWAFGDWWDGRSGHVRSECPPTHWQPLPAAPADGGK